MSEQHWNGPVDVEAPLRGEPRQSYWQGTYCGPEAQAQAQAATDAAPGEPTGASSAASAASPGLERVPGSVSAAARRAYAQEAIRQKDHVSAGLLALFLGMFGVHKFYLGCNNAGFIMLAVSIIGGICTLGLAAAVMWLIAIVEGVIYLSKSQTAFDRAYVLNQRDWF